MSVRLIEILVAGSLMAACASPGDATRSGRPNLSIAWDAREAVRHVFTQGCLSAVEANRPIKETLDRGVPMSRVRPLDVSPLNDRPGTPAYAVISSASVVITGTGERCRIASSSGDGLELRTMLLNILDVQQTGWVSLPAPPPSTPGVMQDVRCRPVAGGVMSVQIVAAPGHPTPLQVFVDRSTQATCSLS